MKKFVMGAAFAVALLAMGTVNAQEPQKKEVAKTEQCCKSKAAKGEKKGCCQAKADAQKGDKKGCCKAKAGAQKSCCKAKAAAKK